LDPTDASKLDVFNLRTGNIWDLENYKTKASSIGIDLFKNFKTEGLDKKPNEIALEINKTSSNPLNLEFLDDSLVRYLNEI